MFNCAVVGVMVMVGNEGAVIVGVAVGRFGVGGTCVVVGSGVRVTTVAVGGAAVNVCVTVGIGTVGEMASVGEAMGVAVGVRTIGLPYSRQPKSGAAPIKPVRGTSGMSSPFTAVYCVIPLSIAGDVACSNKPLKSSSTVSHVPSAPGLGAAVKRGS